jgi:four helix bundle protein
MSDKTNLILEKSYAFALRIVRLYKYLADEKHEYVMSKKLLNAGTDLGAHVKSSQEAEIGSGFAREMRLALQKCSETQFWLQLLHDSESLGAQQFQSIYDDSVELKRILSSIVRRVGG